MSLIWSRETITLGIGACLVSVCIILVLMTVTMRSRRRHRCILTNEVLNPEVKTSILFVIAHPDDESMFFAPVVSAVSSLSHFYEPYILCLSTGDTNQKRDTELTQAASVLGVPASNVVSGYVCDLLIIIDVKL